MKPLFILAVAVLFLSASTTFAQKVKVDVDSSVNFSHYKTFGWDKGPVARNPIITDQIVKAVENQLIARGLTKSDNPDIKVAVMAAGLAPRFVIVIGISPSGVLLPSKPSRAGLKSNASNPDEAMNSMTSPWSPVGYTVLSLAASAACLVGSV